MPDTTTTPIIQHLQFQVAPPSRAELAAAIHAPAALLAILDGVDTTPTVNETVLGIVLSQALEWPLVNIRPLAQVGRFVRCAYTPKVTVDPEIIVTLAGGGAAQEFHRRMVQHQAARREGYRAAWGHWYQRVTESIRQTIPALYALSPTAEEAAFVLRWMLSNAAFGRSITE